MMSLTKSRSDSGDMMEALVVFLSSKVPSISCTTLLRAIPASGDVLPRVFQPRGDLKGTCGDWQLEKFRDSQRSLCHFEVDRSSGFALADLYLLVLL